MQPVFAKRKGRRIGQAHDDEHMRDKPEDGGEEEEGALGRS